ncbi:MAG: hypothetical protein CMJ78_03805, partial [Planctomycetaceae bacterium]|nr:hypothetical protein [Planctomycetaceae bacterium]
PVGAAKADIGITRYIAGLIQVAIDDEAELIAGRKRSIQLMQSGTEATAEETKAIADQEQEDDEEELRDLSVLAAGYRDFVMSETLEVTLGEGKTLHLTNTLVFHHLWFLWFLCWFIPAFAIYAKIMDSTEIKGRVRTLIVSPLRYLWLIPLTLVPQHFMGLLAPAFGPDTSAGIIPQPHLLFYYGIFFGFGALYFDCHDEAAQLGKFWILNLPVALVAFAVGLVSMENRAVTGVAQIIFAWTASFGMIGLYRFVITQEYRPVRYLSDSSYWLYVAHLPLVIWAQGFVREWPLPAFIKFVLLCGTLTVILLLSYQILVRHTPIGTLLNGPRKVPQPAD